MIFKRSLRDFIETMVGFSAVPILWGYGLLHAEDAFYFQKPLVAALSFLGFVVTLSFPYLNYKSFREIIEVKDSGLYLGGGLRKEIFTTWEDFREVMVKVGYRRQMTVKSRQRPLGYTFGFLLDKDKMLVLEAEMQKRLGEKVPWHEQTVGSHRR